jgi:hypothetical protein
MRYVIGVCGRASLLRQFTIRLGLHPLKPSEFSAKEKSKEILRQRKK